MRILYSHRVQSRDGQGVHIEELVAAFRQAGHEVLVVGPGFYDQAAFGGESRMVAMLRRRLRGPAAELAELAYNLLAYRRLHRSWKAFWPDLIYERCNLYFLAGTWLTRRTGTPLYLEVNAPLAEERRLHGGLALAALAARLEHSTWRAAARLLPVTAVLAERLALAGVDPARITVMPNGADPARFHARAEPPGDAPVVLGFVGFVRAWHGLDRVIAGMAEPGGQAVRLTVVGDGPVREALAAQAQALGIAERVHFTGVMAPEDVPSLVAGFDIALQPMATAYASPLKIFDYMAAACAIVAPDQPNIREILTHDHDALLFDPTDAAGIWRSVQALAHDPLLRKRLGAAARSTLQRRNLTWAGNAARIVALAEADLRAVASTSP
jgi:glycosyltransferase involved in cell wall biosynthesis